MMWKRLISVNLAIMIVISSFILISYADTESTAGQILMNYGILTGDQNGSLLENQNMTRTEMMVIFARMLGEYDQAYLWTAPSTFTDGNNHWGERYVAYAQYRGWTNWIENNTFGYDMLLTVREACECMLIALGYSVDLDFTEDTAFSICTSLGLLDNMNLIEENPIFRGELFSMMIKTYNTKIKGDDITLGENIGLPITPFPEDKFPPMIPSNLEVIKVTDSYITLGWDAVSDIDLAGYQIGYRKNGMDLWSELSVGRINTITINHLNYDTGYDFYIQSRDFSGNTSSSLNGITASTLQYITFIDSNLEAEIRSALDKPTGDILASEMTAFYALDISDRNISSLVGLEHATNLIELNAAQNKIIDLEPLTNLTNLKDLKLNGNQIHDLTPLNRLINLNYLDLGYNQINDLTLLSSLENLNELTLSSNLISDLTSLSNLINLKGLDLSENQISNLTPLSDLINLNNLYLAKNTINNLLPLSNLNNLYLLNLDLNQIVDLTPLSGLTNLSELGLSRNQISELTPLIGLTNLMFLEIGSNIITEKEPLEVLIDRCIHVSYFKNPVVQDLKQLTLNNSNLTPQFERFINEYGADVSSTVSSLTISYAPFFETSSAKLLNESNQVISNTVQLKTGENVFYIKVTDYGGFSKTYKIIINRVANPSDTIAPPTPVGLKVSSVNDKQITLNWSAVSAPDLSGYWIEYQKAGEATWMAGSKVGKVTSTTVTGLENEIAYNFIIRSIDTSGNLSSYASIAIGTPIDKTVPAIPTGLTATSGTNRDIVLTWSANSDADFSAYDLVYQKYGTSTWITVPLDEGLTSATVDGLIHNNMYGFKIRAKDLKDNWSNYSTVIYATAKDLVAPEKPVISSIVPKDKSVQVNWAVNQEADLSGYQLEYKAASAATWTIKAQTKTTSIFTITSLINGTDYQIRLKAKDAAGNWSGYSEIHTIIPRDSVAPPVPTGLKVSSVNDKQVTLGWTAVSATDLVGYASEYLPDGETVWTEVGPTGKVTTFTVNGLENEKSYSFRLRSIDTSGNQSGYSAQVIGTPIDKMPPAIPSGLKLTPGTNQDIHVTWNANAEADFAGYNLVYQKYGTSTWITVPLQLGETSATVEGLLHNVRYNFKIQAVDIKGNWSSFSSVVYVTAKDFVAPSAPVITGVTPNDKSIIVNWKSNPESDVNGYQLEYKTAAAASWTIKAQTKTTNTYKILYLVNGTEYQIRLKTKDLAGNWSEYSQVELSVPRDSVAPPVPTGLKVSSVNDKQVTLGWTTVSATDLVGYAIEYLPDGETVWTEVGPTGKVTTFTVNGLENEKSYSFRLRSIDTSGNQSGYSAQVIGTPIDKMPPAIPSGLKLTPGTNQDIHVTWNANTEVDFTGYNLVYQKYGTSTWITVPLQLGETSATVEGLLHNVRYNFKIQAVDIKGNWSSFSSVVYVSAKDFIAPKSPVIASIVPMNRSLLVSWQANSEQDLYGYQLEYKIESSSSWTVKSQPKTAITYSIKYLTNGIKYQVRIKAKDAAGNWSDYSEIITGTPMIN